MLIKHYNLNDYKNILSNNILQNLYNKKINLARPRSFPGLNLHPALEVVAQEVSCHRVQHVHLSPLLSNFVFLSLTLWSRIIDIESLLNRLLKVCYVPATSAGLSRLLFLLRPLKVLMKQTRPAVHAVKQSILLRCVIHNTSLYS